MTTPMRKLQVNQLKVGAVLSYVQTGTHILVALLYTPVMLSILGQNEYGLYNTVSSTISMLSILNLGFSNAYIRYYTRYKTQNEHEKIQRLNGLYILVYSIIGVIAFLCGLYLAFNLRLVFDEGLSEAELEKARIMMLILAVNLGISFPMTTFTAYINAHERFMFERGVNILKVIISPFVQLPLMLLGYGAVGMTAVIFALNLLLHLAEVIYAVKKLNFRMKFGKWEKGLFKSLFLFSGLIAINLIVDQINNSMDNILLGRFCGTAEVAVYAVGATICNYYSSFSTAVSSVFAPRIHKIVNTVRDKLEQNRQLTRLFVKVGRIQYLILALVCSGFVIFGQEFVRLWAGEGYEASYWVVLTRMLPGTIPLIQNIGIEVQQAKNLHRFRSYALLTMAIGNLIMTIFLCRRYGAVGAAVGTGLATILGNGIVMNIVYQKVIGISVFSFWKNILRQTLGMLPAFLCGFLIERFVPIHSFLTMGLWIVVYMAVYGASVWFLSMNAEEKGIALDVVRKVLRKRKQKA